MAKNKNNLPGLVNQAAKNSVGGINLSKSLKPTAAGASSSGASGKVSRPPSLRDTRASSLSGKSVPTGIQFGRPSNAKASTTTQSGGLWTNLLKQSGSSGATGGLTGTLSSFAGIGGLFSSIFGLFGGGGKTTLPALVEFQLPNSISQTVSVSSKGGSGQPVNAAQTPSTAGTAVNHAAGPQQLQYQSAAIAQAVKTALLNSSSLNDVIAEI